MNVKSKNKTKNPKTQKHQLPPEIYTAVDNVCFAFPHVQMPIVRLKNGIKRCNCLSEASCLHRPIFRPRNWEAEGQMRLRRLLLLTFLGEARKVSGRRATPGQRTLGTRESKKEYETLLSCGTHLLHQNPN